MVKDRKGKSLKKAESSGLSTSSENKPVLPSTLEDAETLSIDPIVFDHQPVPFEHALELHSSEYDLSADVERRLNSLFVNPLDTMRTRLDSVLSDFSEMKSRRREDNLTQYGLYLDEIRSFIAVPPKDTLHELSTNSFSTILPTISVANTLYEMPLWVRNAAMQERGQYIRSTIPKKILRDQEGGMPSAHIVLENDASLDKGSFTQSSIVDTPYNTVPIPFAIVPDELSVQSLDPGIASISLALSQTPVSKDLGDVLDDIGSMPGVDPSTGIVPASVRLQQMFKDQDAATQKIADQKDREKAALELKEALAEDARRQTYAAARKERDRKRNEQFELLNALQGPNAETYRGRPILKAHKVAVLKKKTKDSSGKIWTSEEFRLNHRRDMTIADYKKAGWEYSGQENADLAWPIKDYVVSDDEYQLLKFAGKTFRPVFNPVVTGITEKWPDVVSEGARQTIPVEGLTELCVFSQELGWHYEKLDLNKRIIPEKSATARVPPVFVSESAAKRSPMPKLMDILPSQEQYASYGKVISDSFGASIAKIGAAAAIIPAAYHSLHSKIAEYARSRTEKKPLPQKASSSDDMKKDNVASPTAVVSEEPSLIIAPKEDALIQLSLERKPEAPSVPSASSVLLENTVEGSVDDAAKAGLAPTTLYVREESAAIPAAASVLPSNSKPIPAKEPVYSRMKSAVKGFASEQFGKIPSFNKRKMSYALGAAAAAAIVAGAWYSSGSKKPSETIAHQDAAVSSVALPSAVPSYSGPLESKKPNVQSASISKPAVDGIAQTPVVISSAGTIAKDRSQTTSAAPVIATKRDVPTTLDAAVASKLPKANTNPIGVNVKRKELAPNIALPIEFRYATNSSTLEQTVIIQQRVGSGIKSGLLKLYGLNGNDSPMIVRGKQVSKSYGSILSYSIKLDSEKITRLIENVDSKSQKLQFVGYGSSVPKRSERVASFTQKSVKTPAILVNCGFVQKSSSAIDSMQNSTVDAIVDSLIENPSIKLNGAGSISANSADEYIKGNSLIEHGARAYSYRMVADSSKERSVAPTPVRYSWNGFSRPAYLISSPIGITMINNPAPVFKFFKLYNA